MWVQLCTAEVSSMVEFIHTHMAKAQHSKWKQVITYQNMFAREHITCDKITGFYPVGNGRKTITFEIPKLNDMIDALYIQTKWPALDHDGENFTCYVWALGYASWQSIEIKIGNTKVAHVPSTREEMVSELCSEPGRLVREMGFKWEEVSWANLQKLSSRSFTLYTPVKSLWFTQQGNELALNGLGRSQIDAILHTRAIHEFTASLPYVDPLDQSQAPSLHDNDDIPKAGGAELSWANQELDFNLLLGVVTLPPEESDHFLDAEMHYLVTNYQSTIGEMDEHGIPFPVNSDTLSIINHPFKYPTGGIMFAIADVNRGSVVTDFVPSSAQPTDTQKTTPWKGGVRSLFGDRADLGSYHVLDDGCKIPSAAEIAAGQKFTAGIKKYCCASGMGPWLPKNLYDYRMATKDGVEVEPLKSLRIKFGGDNRIQEDLPGSYFRLITQFEHYKRIVRQGIYTYSFDDDSASHTTFSHGANLTQITNVEFTFVAGRKSEVGHELELLYWLPHKQIYKMHRGIIHEKFNG